jgi:uncharacterized protein (DUF58 family)
MPAATPLDTLIEKARRLELGSRHRARSRYAGLYSSAFKGQGIEFADVREYAPGDDVRHIDWNVSARSGALHVKTMNEERDRSVLVVLDTSATLDFGSVRRTKFDLAVELASLFILLAFQARDRVSLLLAGSRPDRYVAPAKGWIHTSRLIREVVSRAPAGAPPEMEQLWSFLSSPGIPRSLVVAVLDFHVRLEATSALGAASRKHEIVAFVVSDPLEFRLPDAGRIRLRDPATGRVSFVRTGRGSVRAEFARAAAERRARLRATFGASGVDCAEFSTADDYEPSLRRFLQRRSQR